MKRTISQYDLDSFIETDHDYKPAAQDSAKTRVGDYDMSDLVEVDMMLRDVLNELFSKSNIIAMLYKSDDVTIVKCNDDRDSSVYKITSHQFASAVSNVRHASRQELQNVFSNKLHVDVNTTRADIETYDLVKVLN